MIKVSQEEKNVIDKVEESVCKYFSVPSQRIINKDMTSQVSLARGYIFYILHVDKKISINKIANVYLRQKRVVFWNVSKIRHLLKLKVYKEIYDNICEI